MHRSREICQANREHSGPRNREWARRKSGPADTPDSSRLHPSSIQGDATKGCRGGEQRALSSLEERRKDEDSPQGVRWSCAVMQRGCSREKPTVNGVQVPWGPESARLHHAGTLWYEG